jgi:hypothetical protein
MFEKELAMIEDDTIRGMAEQAVALIPDYFYTIAASSSGKYHPNYALGDGGLYRHVCAAVGIAQQLFRIYNFNRREQDLIIASLIPHDGWKQGYDAAGWTLHEHPAIAADELKKNIRCSDGLEEFYLTVICANIRCHMGQWNVHPKSDVVLPTPQTEMQKFVHLCDYLASRKALEYNFEVME